MSGHTPSELPWRVEPSNGRMDSAAKFETGSRVLIFSDECEYHPVADCSCNHTCLMPDEQEDNAAFIVKAVNSHAANEAKIEALVAVLKRARDIVHDVAIATRNVGYDADLRAIDDALRTAAGEK